MTKVSVSCVVRIPCSTVSPVKSLLLEESVMETDTAVEGLQHH